MPTAENQILVCTSGPTAVLRVTGRVNFKYSADFKKALMGLFERGQVRFVLDLSECLSMDSTFLGVMLGFALKTPAGPAGRPVVALCQPQPRILDLLDELGVRDQFQFTDRLDSVCGQFSAAPATGTPASKEELSQTSLEAHKTLMEANPDNIARFKDVVKFLEEDLSQGK